MLHQFRISAHFDVLIIRTKAAAPLHFLLVILEIVPQRVESLATHLYDNAMRYAGAPESGRLSCHNQFGENNEP